MKRIKFQLKWGKPEQECYKSLILPRMIETGVKPAIMKAAYCVGYQKGNSHETTFLCRIVLRRVLSLVR